MGRSLRAGSLWSARPQESVTAWQVVVRTGIGPTARNGLGYRP